MHVPERVSRFLTRLAGWEEASPAEQAGANRFAVLARPRGDLIVHGAVSDAAEGASYG
jgi:hypothetical protein